MASSGEGSNRTWHHSDGKRLDATQAEPSVPSEATTGNDQGSKPVMVDIMSGSNYPLAKGFEMAGWRILAVDYLFEKEHDLSKPDNQETIRRQLKHADFIWAALDCSDKSRIREIPRKHANGKAMPWYPSKEEAEYTACLVFHIVYSASAWACRVGRAKLAIPRQPPVECTGDRREWLTIDARALRGWAMIPMALAMGLNIGERWSKRTLSLMAATTGNAWRAICSEKGSMARQPPLSLGQTHRWQQQVLTETFVSYFPEDVFEGFNFPYIEDAVNLPAFNRYAEWTERRGIPPGCPRPPSQVEKIAAGAARGAEGVQLRAFSQKAALPPLISFGQEDDKMRFIEPLDGEKYKMLMGSRVGH